MKRTIGFAGSLFLAAALVSCGGSGGGAYTKMANGMEYKIISSGKGAAAAYGDVMKFYITQRYKDSVMKQNYDQPPTYQPIDSMQLPKEYFEIFKQVKPGDSVVTRMLTDSIFKGGLSMMPKEFKKGEYLSTSIKVVDILKADKAQEDFTKEAEKMRARDSVHAIAQKSVDDKLLQEYFAKNNVKAEKTEGGTYYEIQKAGGESAKEGQIISVKYTGKLLDGTTFDSNVDSSFNHTEPFDLPLGAGRAIKGFDDGLRHFGKGTVGRLFIPSTMAYGNQGQGKIKPNSNLIFEIEVLDVKDVPSAPAPQPVKPAVTPVKPAKK